MLESQIDSAPLLSHFLTQEILTIADRSVPPLQEATGTDLAETECSAPVGLCRELANKGCCSPPQRLGYTHGKLEVKNLNTVITGAVSLKSADREECSTNNCCDLRWLIWSYPITAGSQSAACNNLSGRQRVLINSWSEWVILKGLRRGSGQVMW